MTDPHVQPPTQTRGTPSTLREAVVQTVNSDGTVDLKATDSRVGWRQVAVPGWYSPTVGDHVYVGPLQGDAQKVAVLAPKSGAPLLSQQSAATTYLTQQSAAATYALIPPLVTTGSLAAGQGGIPSPVPDGFEVRFLADATNGNVWHLRYRSGSTSPYQWEFIGGSSLYAFDPADAAATQTNGSYVNTSVAASLTLPLAGDYDIENGGYGFGSVVVANMLSYSVGATAASDTDAAHADGTAGESATSLRRKTGVSAASVLQQKMRNGSGVSATIHWANRFLRATPVRVG